MIAMLFALAAAAAPPNAMAAYETCLADMAETFDDQVSDAGTIAVAVAADCSAEREDFIVKYAVAGQSADDIQRLLNDKAKAQESALQAVLMERARRRDHMPASPPAKP